ncbi:iron chelate uptake ABC transporter family permease subunit [Mariniblastus fucicola]|uniref:Manganese transport system membrane protein MntB n=1 Tax=Mariniblastus fucicola TaxID=980251 RepID=A0A5B9P9G2_9BACT|nr:iron chelate uptake ABC transporter family permease subunit [Mariniblastus fucicola]QEG21246.1 Manganese transport system membrane protein MntB [Mariniblastus fucicola]
MNEFLSEYGYLIKPLATGTLVSIVCSVLGCFIILRRMSFLADAIAHSMLAGVIAGYLIVKMVLGGEAETGAMLLGAIIAGVITVGMVGFVTRFSRLKEDTAIGIMYTGIFAIGSFVLSLEMFGQYIHIDIYHYIVGSIVSANVQKLWLAAIVSSIVLSVVILFYRPLQLTSFDPVMAASIGIPVLAVDYMLTTCTSLVVVCGVQIAGVILVVAMIITPAASAYLLSDRLDRMVMLSAILGAVGFWVGFFAAGALGASAGASVVVTMTLIFLLCLVFAPRYGLVADWVRKNNTVPQEVMEDVLGVVLRNDGKPMPISDVLKYVENPNSKIRKAIHSLARQGMLEFEDDKVKLTDDGEFHANRLIRAHRLWETYLDKTRTPKTEIHGKAHQLEHISDQATVEYLDDKLGHPLTDPHGSNIPTDVRKRDGLIMASLLRKGHQAKVVRIKKLAKKFGLSQGEVITMAARRNDGETWVMVTPSGTEIELTHDEADAILVEFVD